MLPQMAWTECGLIWVSPLHHSTGGPWPHSSPSVLRMAHKGPDGCVPLSQLQDHPQKGKHTFSQLLFMPQMGPKWARRPPFCTPPCLVDVCVSCSPSMSHYHPYFPTKLVETTLQSGRNHTSHMQFWCLWIQFNSDTTYLETESNFKVKIQSQETALHFRCQLQTPGFTCICD